MLCKKSRGTKKIAPPPRGWQQPRRPPCDATMRRHYATTRQEGQESHQHDEIVSVEVSVPCIIGIQLSVVNEVSGLG